MLQRIVTGKSLEAFTYEQFLAVSFPLLSWVNYSTSPTESTYEWGGASFSPTLLLLSQARYCHLFPTCYHSLLPASVCALPSSQSEL